MFRRSRLLGLVLSPFVAPSLFAQSEKPLTPDTANPITTIHVGAPTVVVDILATDNKENSVTGLNKEDFRSPVGFADRTHVPVLADALNNAVFFAATST